MLHGCSSDCLSRTNGPRPERAGQSSMPDILRRTTQVIAGHAAISQAIPGASYLAAGPKPISGPKTMSGPKPISGKSGARTGHGPLLVPPHDEEPRPRLAKL